jgi:hypothetical protein
VPRLRLLGDRETEGDPVNTTAYIDPELAEDLYESDDGDKIAGWTRITDRRDGNRRWMEDHTLIITDPEGLAWGLHYQVGLTEDQEDELPWRGTGDEPLALIRLYPHTVTRTVYRTAPQEETP